MLHVTAVPPVRSCLLTSSPLLLPARGALMQGSRGGRDRGPAATSHRALVPGRGSYSSTLLCWAFWPLRVGAGGGVGGHQPHATSPTCLALGVV